ncbi:hypothetical protein [Pseudonocardia sp. GCM10023141]|uniref:hypothetical protein n=1 Tax=Pseudonocardia sp. GCM10023141 TaxID=3252653 RepID=UPI0036216CD2
MTAVARFRLFGRPTAVEDDAADPQPAPGPPPGWAAAPPPVGAGVPWPEASYGPATRAARPVPQRPLPPPAAMHQPDPDGPGRNGSAFNGGPYDGGAAGSRYAPPPAHRDPRADPPTDPFGFPPIAAAGYGAGGRRTVPTPDAAEASALAGAFAVDYLSWNQDDPERRGCVLVDYLSTPGSDPARLGWSGRGRQRAEFALPGGVRPDGDGRVLVDVRVRVTPYRAVGDHGGEPAAAEPEPDIAGTPAVAPAPTGRGWRSLASYWIRLSVPVALEGGRLVVDAWEETLGELPPVPVSAGPAPDDHTLADDDPLVDQHPGGGW